jgi:general secretion pathway protein K
MSLARQEGFALVLVLWGLVLLSLVASALVVETRRAAALSQARVGEAEAALAAEAGIERALIAIDSGPDERAWPEDGTPIVWRFAGSSVAIAIEDEGGKIDAFNAPDLLLSAALGKAGLGADKQRKVMSELRQIPALAGFDGAPTGVASLDELAGITSLSSTEIERLRPFLSVRNGLAGLDPQVARADLIVHLPGVEAAGVASFAADRKRGLARADAQTRLPSPAPAFTQISPRSAFTIRAEACTAGGHLAIREAMVRRMAPGAFARLELREPTGPRFAKGCPASRHS